MRNFSFFGTGLVIVSAVALALIDRNQQFLLEFRAALGITLPTGLALFLSIGIFTRNENRAFRTLLTGFIVMVASAVCMMRILFVGTQSAG